MAQAVPLLSPLQVRVLGVLVEKQHTVPDTYPLSLNALVAGCNQKTSRDPVMNAGDADVQEAVDELKRLSLLREGSGSRVTRYEHNVERVLQLPTQSLAIIAVLMLRGPQTPGELRINCERFYKFSDISSVEAFLDELRERPAGALVTELVRRPGARENRWAHLLCGAPAEEAVAVLSAVPDVSAAPSNLEHRLEQLEHDVAELRAMIEQLRSPRTA